MKKKKKPKLNSQQITCWRIKKNLKRNKKTRPDYTRVSLPNSWSSCETEIIF
jgi:hypothetical protein